MKYRLKSDPSVTVEDCHVGGTDEARIPTSVFNAAFELVPDEESADFQLLDEATKEFIRKKVTVLRKEGPLQGDELWEWINSVKARSSTRMESVVLTEQQIGDYIDKEVARYREEAASVARAKYEKVPDSLAPTTLIEDELDFLATNRVIRSSTFPGTFHRAAAEIRSLREAAEMNLRAAQHTDARVKELKDKLHAVLGSKD